jgi:hypothetical protein
MKIWGWCRPVRLVLRDIQGFSYDEMRDIVGNTRRDGKIAPFQSEGRLEGEPEEGVRRPLMECRKIQGMLAPCLEGVVTPEQRLLVREHLSSCGECKAAMEDLKKTIALMKGLEEVEPPPWLSQKIMACVREQAETKGGILRRLFFPFHIKVPLEVFATFLIVGLVAYVYKTTTPQFEAARMSDKAQVFRQGEPSPPTPEDAFTAARQGRGTRPEAGRSKRAETTRGNDKEASRQESAEQASEEQEKLTGAERSLQEKEKVGILRGQADYAQESGGSLRASRPEAPAFAPDEGRSPSPQKRLAVACLMAAPPEPASMSVKGNRSERLNLTVLVADVDAAAQQVEKLLLDAGARHVTRSSGEAAESVSAELRGDKIHSFVQKLNSLGDTGGPKPGIPGGDMIAVRIGLVGVGKADEK